MVVVDLNRVGYLLAKKLGGRLSFSSCDACLEDSVSSASIVFGSAWYAPSLVMMRDIP